MKLNVLYEDNHLIAVYKPAGMLVQGDHSGDSTLLDEVKYFLKQKYNKPGNVFLGMLHRLDRPVSGIILFAKTSKGAARLSEQFRERTIDKEYHALVEGTPKHSKGTLVHYLLKDVNKNKVQVNLTPMPGGLRAELDYEVVKGYHKEGVSLLKVQLKTGRSHQIRAQLSSMGCPIVGDVKYGAKREFFSKIDEKLHHTIALCSTRLHFALATGEEEKEITISYPAEWDNA